MKYLVLWELCKKQDYIFKSNKLKECIGASQVIKSFSEGFEDDNLLEDHFIIKGGGKILYYFDNENERKSFVKKFSGRLLKDYPGLELCLVIDDYDDNDDNPDNNIKSAITKIYEKLDRKKRMRLNSCGQSGFGIERTCQSTGGVASFKDDENRYISSEVKAKIGCCKNDDFKKIISDMNEYEVLKTVGDMVRDESKSYLALVHIDGNGMGKKINNITKSICINDGENKSDFDKRYIRTMQQFSTQIADANELSLKEVCRRINGNKDKLKNITRIEDRKFPLRPLIMAGDDITFICNGAIGIECAKIFIEKLKEQKLNIEGINDESFTSLNACAGISIFRKNYPFRVAYRLTEELCENAKSFLGDRKLEASAIDFHLCQGEISAPLKEIREDNYKIDDNYSLTMKPLIVGNSKNFDDGVWRNYDNFLRALEYIHKAVNNKNIGRNKIKSLRNELIKGQDAIKLFLKFYKIKPGYVLQPLNDTKGDYCFNEIKDQRSGTYKCMYFDAIEIMDFFMKLD